MEGTTIFGPNVVTFLLMLGERRWYVVGAYVPPNYVPAVHRMEQALRAAPKRAEMVLMGDLNARLGYPRDEREEYMVTALVDRGLVNITYHFMPRRRYMGSRKLDMVHAEGREAGDGEGGIHPLHRKAKLYQRRSAVTTPWYGP